MVLNSICYEGSSSWPDLAFSHSLVTQLSRLFLINWHQQKHFNSACRCATEKLCLVWLNFHPFRLPWWAWKMNRNATEKWIYKQHTKKCIEEVEHLRLCERTAFIVGKKRRKKSTWIIISSRYCRIPSSFFLFFSCFHLSRRINLVENNCILVRGSSLSRSRCHMTRRSRDPLPQLIRYVNRRLTGKRKKKHKTSFFVACWSDFPNEREMRYPTSIESNLFLPLLIYGKATAAFEREWEFVWYSHSRRRLYVIFSVRKWNWLDIARAQSLATFTARYFTVRKRTYSIHERAPTSEEKSASSRQPRKKKVIPK